MIRRVYMDHHKERYATSACSGTKLMTFMNRNLFVVTATPLEVCRPMLYAGDLVLYCCPWKLATVLLIKWGTGIIRLMRGMVTLPKVTRQKMVVGDQGRACSRFCWRQKRRHYRVGERRWRVKATAADWLEDDKVKGAVAQQNGRLLGYSLNLV